MSDRPPRQRRSQPRPPARGGSPLPWIALVIGVVVAGLGIGALISAYQNRGAPTPQIGAGVPPVTPVPQESATAPPSPLGIARATPSPSPVPTAAPSPTPRSTALPTASPAATPLATASPAPSPSPEGTTAPTVSPTPEPTAKTTPEPTAKPTPEPTAKPAPSPLATARPTPAPPEPASTPVATHASPDAAATVRRYLEAIIAGNTSAAAAMLDAGGTVKEGAFLDDTSRITNVRVTRTDASGSFVEAEISAARGSYVATFHVRAGGGGTIDQHDYIKV